MRYFDEKYEDTINCHFTWIYIVSYKHNHSTVTLFAKFLGISTFRPL